VPLGQQPDRRTVERTDDGRSTPAARRDVFDEATAVVNAAAEGVCAGQEDPDGVAHAAGELLSTLALRREYRVSGPLTMALDRFDRAARGPRPLLAANAPPAPVELRTALRTIDRHVCGYIDAARLGNAA
jgi:hypothetical protein